MFQINDFKEDLKNETDNDILIKYVFSNNNWYFKNKLKIEDSEILY